MLATVLALTLTSASLTDSPTSARCESCSLIAQATSSASNLEARRLELRRRIDDLGAETRSMKTDFPIGSLVLAYAGYVFAPFLLLGVPLIAVAPVLGGTALAIGIALTAVGAAGVVALILGLTSGFKAQEELRARRDSLVKERLRLEDELKSLPSRSGDLSPTPPQVTLTLLTFG